MTLRPTSLCYREAGLSTLQRWPQRHDVIEKLDYQHCDVVTNVVMFPKRCIFNIATLKSNVATLQRGVFSTSRRWDPTL